MNLEESGRAGSIDFDNQGAGRRSSDSLLWREGQDAILPPRTASQQSMSSWSPTYSEIASKSSSSQTCTYATTSSRNGLDSVHRSYVGAQINIMTEEDMMSMMTEADALRR